VSPRVARRCREGFGQFGIGESPVGVLVECLEELSEELVSAEKENEASASERVSKLELGGMKTHFGDSSTEHPEGTSSLQEYGQGSIRDRFKGIGCEIRD
jgi:hypothetical protein